MGFSPSLFSHGTERSFRLLGEPLFGGPKGLVYNTSILETLSFSLTSLSSAFSSGNPSWPCDSTAICPSLHILPQQIGQKLEISIPLSSKHSEDQLSHTQRLWEHLFKFDFWINPKWLFLGKRYVTLSQINFPCSQFLAPSCCKDHVDVCWKLNSALPGWPQLNSDLHSNHALFCISSRSLLSIDISKCSFTKERGRVAGPKSPKSGQWEQKGGGGFICRVPK